MSRLHCLLFCVAGQLVPATAAAQTLDGFWQSEGYGNVYEIRGPMLKMFEVTAKTCVAGMAAKQTKDSIDGVEAAFKERDGAVWHVSSGSDNKHKVLSRPRGLYKLRIARLPRKPSVCDPPTANTPLGNFDVFSRTFAEHYINFDLKKVDWKRVVADSQSKITPHTTPAELFEILAAMIRPLADVHTGIEAPRLKREFDPPYRPGTERVMKGGEDHFTKKGRRELFAITDHAYLRSGLRKFCNGQIWYGHIDGSTGYLRILAFGGYAGRGQDLAALESALDQIFSDPKLHALVIDVRLSFGGDDHIGLAIASRLATSEYPAYSIQARSDPFDSNKWSTADSVLVRPASRPGFHGPVVELISRVTMSAAETFSQALMGRRPAVTRIGESTQGVFCDPLDRRLPNGWTFELPNSVYRAEDGTAFDVRGIPPDIESPVFDDKDVAAGKDPAMDLALRSLSASSHR